MTFIIGIDVGGTFTDGFASDTAGGGRQYSAKTPSTPPDLSIGFMNAVDELAAAAGLTRRELLSQTGFICHGTTQTLNALVTGAVSVTGFITTKGHADTIRIMNGEGRHTGLTAEQVQDIPHTDKPRALVPRGLIAEVTERVDYKGDVIVPLNESETRAAVAGLVDRGAEAIAVSLLWGFRNPAHERRVRDLIRQVDPRIEVGLASEISPRIREYPRAVTTIMSTQVAGRLRAYLEPLEARLAGSGFRGRLLVMQGSGGAVSSQTAPQRAISTVGSVLTGGLVGSARLARSLNHRNVITTDMGGTTFLVGVIADGKPTMVPSTLIGQYSINVPTADVKTIGSGGGAIARLEHGRLRVGPTSAEAKPGPACYAAGGTQPTVTDANVALGIIDPENFLGGAIRLHSDLALKAIDEQIAAPLGISVDQAAAAIYAVACAQAADLIRRAVVHSGKDPRHFTLYAYGGAAPAHCAHYARELGVETVIVPLGAAATFSAFGLAASDVLLTSEISVPSEFPLDENAVERTFRQLEHELDEQALAQQIPFDTLSKEREVDVRYSQQLAEITVPVAPGPATADTLRGLEESFNAKYETLFGRGTSFRSAGLQAITFRVTARAVLPGQAATRPQVEVLSGGTTRPYTRRRALLDPSSGWQTADVYRYDHLGYGDVVAGPAIIEASSTTVVVPDWSNVVLDSFGNAVITVSSRASTTGIAANGEAVYREHDG